MKYTKDELAAVANFYKEHLQNPPPEMRNILLYLAKDAFENNQNQNAVYFQTEALCISFDSKNIFKVNSLDSYSDNFLEDAVFLKHNTKKPKNSNPLLDFAKKEFLTKEIRYTTKDFDLNFDINAKISNMKVLLKDMPPEWMILQITKGYNENMSLQSRENNLTSELPIYLSILKHPRDNLGNFICVKMEFNDADTYCNFFKIQEMFKALSRDIEKDVEEAKLEYQKKILPLENQIVNSLAKLEKEFGPWLCFFSGNLANEELRDNIFQNVDNFCEKYKLDNNTKMILGLLLNEPKKLTSENCKIASDYLSKGKSKRINNLLNKFLVNTAEELLNDDITLKMELKNPCLLLVDELVDHFPWEFLNKSQEFCRISSLNILNQIFRKHKYKINKGYLNVNIKTGHFLVNPQNNLKEAENRIRAFGNYWLSNFNYIYGQQPSHEQIKQIFNSCGIYVYCGHGHGMDYLNPHKLQITEIKNPVVFLFGCESVKLSAKTSYGEMIGEHLYFHKGLCPAVIGCIHIAFDYKLDMLATEILSTWISSKQKTHWCNIDLELWRKGNIDLKKSQKCKQFKYEPRLAAILSKIRAKGSQKYYHLIPLVYRGIPVWNNQVGDC